ncbi:MAG: hypothetical protein KME52_28555 [Desmonostoc geniculatum HA4340-LM1]|jgi:hypothetical protein|nr:hypothetical protein [Desmonostoc geniculatum HA4340-LM1]
MKSNRFCEREEACELNEFPYYDFEKSVFFTDGVEEILVQKFDHKNTAKNVSTLLNKVYGQGYQDGLNASLNGKYKELVDQ